MLLQVTGKAFIAFLNALNYTAFCNDAQNVRKCVPNIEGVLLAAVILRLTKVSLIEKNPYFKCLHKRLYTSYRFGNSRIGIQPLSVPFGRKTARPGRLMHSPADSGPAGASKVLMYSCTRVCLCFSDAPGALAGLTGT